MGDIHRSQGNGLCPAPLGKVRFHANFRWFRNTFPLCRGGPMCPPVFGSREGACPGRHRGRLRRRDGRQHANPANGRGRSPAPTGQAAGRCRHRPLRKNGGYGAASPLEIAAVRPRRAAKRLRPSREKSRKGPKAPSWFPPPAERSRIIFRRGVYVTKNPSHEATCKKGPTPVGSDPFCAKAKCNAPSGNAGGGIGHRAAQGRHGAGGL